MGLVVDLGTLAFGTNTINHFTPAMYMLVLLLILVIRQKRHWRDSCFLSEAERRYYSRTSPRYLADGASGVSNQKVNNERSGPYR